MPRWLDRVEASLANDDTRRAKARKAFVMPPFWSEDGARVRLAASSAHPDRELIGEGFSSYVDDLFKANGPVFACIALRIRVFSQARLLFQRMQGGRPVELYGGGDPGLKLLERPWDRGSTANLLTDMEIDGSLAGNHFAVMVDQSGRIGTRAKREDGAFLARMRPDWCTLIIHAPRSGNPYNVDARVVALQYRPPGSGDDPLLLTRKEFSHFAPLPDPSARFRGMSWLTPIIKEARADDAYTTHATAFLKNGATPNLVVKVGDDVEDEEFKMFVSQFKEDYEGASNAYKTLFLAGGADVTPLSVDLNQLALRESQAALETRIASASGVHVILSGFSEGLGGSSLNEGNFGAARRLFVDSTIRDLWGKAAPALEIFAPPTREASRLWYDARDIPFLRQDAGDEAKTFFTQVQSARQAVEGGWEPDAAIDAAKAADISLLKGKHTGKVSVQLRDPNAQEPPVTSTGDNATGADGEDGTTMPTLNGPPTNGNRPALTAR